MPLNAAARGSQAPAPATVNVIGLVLTVLGYALVLLPGSTYWTWMGYMTR